MAVLKRLNKLREQEKTRKISVGNVDAVGRQNIYELFVAAVVLY